VTLSTADQQSLRYHLGYGNLDVAAPNAYTGDGFYELFRDVVAPYLMGEAETTGATAIVAGTSQAVTPASMTGILVGSRLMIDVADDAEIVVVRSKTSLTFTAKFAKAHPNTGYLVAVESGLTRLRALLQAADTAHASAVSASITTTAGLKSVGRGAVEWFGTGAVLSAVEAHYVSIVQRISSLVHVPIAGGGSGRSSPVLLEAY
jgi:ketopantoate hydroxymethyltransferase